MRGVLYAAVWVTGHEESAGGHRGKPERPKNLGMGGASGTGPGGLVTEAGVGKLTFHSLKSPVLGFLE